MNNYCIIIIIHVPVMSYMCQLISVHVLYVVNQSYPVKNGQVHPHVESASGEVDPLWDICEHHVVKDSTEKVSRH